VFDVVDGGFNPKAPISQDHHLRYALAVFITFFSFQWNFGAANVLASDYSSQDGFKNFGVSDTVAHSGSKSLMLQHKAGAVIPIDTPVIQIGYEVAVYPVGSGGCIGFTRSGPGGEQGLWTTPSEWWADVCFDSTTNTIRVENAQSVGNWQSNTWYVVKVTFNRDNGYYRVWVNGEFKGDWQSTTSSSPGTVNAFGLSSGDTVFFDDIRLFVSIQII
jgi:hypothetical protein